MTLLFWGLTISTVGKVMVAVGVLWAHSELIHERKVDKIVIRTFGLERWITIIGLLLIVIGYVLEIMFYGFTPLMECGFDECATASFQSFLQ